jgi:phage N-6-adenine-methyltransferase
MPAQKPGTSFQAYKTPRDFLDAVEERFGPIDFDLAADKTNTVVPEAYFDKKRDTLVQQWHLIGGLLWLNPEFGTIKPYAKKCATEAEQGAKILFLTPASTGADWYQRHLVPHGYVIDLAPRLSFDGVSPFPKDLTLTVFMHGLVGRGFWRWK